MAAQLPAYFDSQAQASGMLGIDVYRLKEAKAAGCPAFKGGGRIRRDELLKWLQEHQRSNGRAEKPDDGIVSAAVWADRRSVLFDVLEFLHGAHHNKQIDLAEYAGLGNATVELLIKIGKAWKAGIDEAGYRKTWRGCIAAAARRKNEENNARLRKNKSL